MDTSLLDAAKLNVGQEMMKAPGPIEVPGPILNPSKASSVTDFRALFSPEV
jgi:hypothetical protein